MASCECKNHGLSLLRTSSSCQLRDENADCVLKLASAELKSALKDILMFVYV